MSNLMNRAASLLAAVIASLALASPALADDGDPGEVVVQQTAGTAQTCQDPIIVNPFTTFGDLRDYVLAPYGDFEHSYMDGWSLEGGAGTVIDEHGNGALDLPAGSTATSPAMCIDLNYPTVRFFVRNVVEEGDLEVQVMYVDHKKAYKPKTVKKLKAKRPYGLTKDIKIDPDRGGKEEGWRRIAFRFVADEDKGNFRVDDLYVDPRLRG